MSIQKNMMSPVETKRTNISANESLSHGHCLIDMDTDRDVFRTI
jgi:hypothetical protein